MEGIPELDDRKVREGPLIPDIFHYFILFFVASIVGTKGYGFNTYLRYPASQKTRFKRAAL